LIVPLFHPSGNQIKAAFGLRCATAVRLSVGHPPMAFGFCISTSDKLFKVVTTT